MNNRRFLKHTVAAAALALGALPAAAICATPYPVSVTQPDGTQLTLTMRGDENGYVMLTADGYAVMQNPATGLYEFAAPEGNAFRLLSVAAQEPALRSAQTNALLATLDRDAVIPTLDRARSASAMRKAPLKRVKISNYPTLGHQKALVILVAFEDTKFSTMPDAYDYYNRMLNEEGFTWDNGANGSARDFYLASSDGMFDPEFTVVGPVTLDKPCEYYGGDTKYLDENAIDMVVEACTAADSLVDFSEYDADGDGYVDNIYFFYAGYGQADSGHSSAIWPHSGTIEESWGKELILDDIRINRYACSNEIRYGSGPNLKPVGIGTFVHEFGHVLGIADHYDTLYSSGRTGVNDWDTMAGASYRNDQNTPPLFNTFERAELEWMEYTDIPADTAGWLDLPTIDLGAKAYRFVVDGTEGREYFILEARQQRGWDEYLPGHGMLVWHVDMDEEKWQNNTLNTDGKHQCFDLIEADKKENDASYAADPFPGKNGVTSFEFKNWAGEVEFLLDHITETPDNIRLLLGGTEFMPETPELSIHRVGGKTLQFSWAPVADAQHYCVSLRDEEGNVAGDLEDAVIETPAMMSVESLEPLTTYTLEVSAKIGSYRSVAASHTFTTSDLCFFEMTPEFNVPEAVYGDTFKISWLPMADATDYTVSLDEMYFGEAVNSECDFSEIPDGWETSSSKYNKALFGKASPALQLDKDEDYLLFSADGLITGLTFWTRSQSASNVLRLEYMVEGDEEWTLLEELAMKTSAQTLTFDIPSATQVRLTYQKKSGYVLVDDIICEYSPLSWLPLAAYTGFSTGGECRFVPQGLKFETTYRVSLAGMSGEEQSRTAITRVTTGDTSGVTAAPASAAEIISRFDISGRKVGQDFKGLVIERLSDGSARKRLTINH